MVAAAIAPVWVASWASRIRSTALPMYIDAFPLWSVHATPDIIGRIVVALAPRLCVVVPSMVALQLQTDRARDLYTKRYGCSRALPVPAPDMIVLLFAFHLRIVPVTSFASLWLQAGCANRPR